MGPYGSLWVPMCPYVSLWVPMCPYVSLWVRCVPQALWAALLPLLALSAPHALLPALLAALWGGATLGAALLRFTPRLPHGDCVEALRSCSGAVVAAVVALMAIVASRSVMAAVTFSLALGLALLYAYDAFGTIRTRLAPPHDPQLNGT
ncbi:uncharacterized protein LOC112531456 isoform X1 [Gallus gallus]|uniref:uncharacterized protein LOC112531456 isoform X1 n=1 Tax=Gallus gallus TaxID=9031 RepID=UPI001AE2C328|nr:uncharacterized protein LOC112531456 isoform X1 [Gallus gallus]